MQLTEKEQELAEKFKEYCEKKYTGSFVCILQNLCDKAEKDKRKGRHRKLFAKH